MDNNIDQILADPTSWGQYTPEVQQALAQLSSQKTSADTQFNNRLSDSNIVGNGSTAIAQDPQQRLSVLMSAPQQTTRAPMPQNYIQNNSTGNVTAFPSYVERQATPAPTDANAIIRFSQQNNVDPALVPAMIQYQTQANISGAQMPNVLDLYRQSFQSGIPFEQLLQAQATQQQGTVAANAANMKNQAAIADIAKTKAQTDSLTGANAGTLDKPTLNAMAEQYLSGDKSVFANLGRGIQGSKNIALLRQTVAEQMQAQGMSGRDVAAKMAEFAGLTAAQRTVGTRTANVELAATEASNILPLAREASKDVQRSGLLPFGKAQIMFDENTNDPALRRFAAANNALVNVYARAISPNGTPTVSDKEHGRALLSTAFDDASYQATLDQMQREIDAAQAAPQSVRKAFSKAISGQESATPASSGRKITTQAEVQATAAKYGVPVAKVIADAKAKGYTVQ